MVGMVMAKSTIVEIKPSFRKKVNHSIYVNALKSTIRDATKDAEMGCRATCPVDTGRLRSGHSSEVNGLEGKVRNSVDYWRYVVYGTKNRKPNNYPKRAVTKIKGDYAKRKYFQHLRSSGVL